MTLECGMRFLADSRYDVYLKQLLSGNTILFGQEHSSGLKKEMEETVRSRWRKSLRRSESEKKLL